MKDKIEFHFTKPEESSGFLLWQLTMQWQRSIKRALDPLGITHTQFVLLASLAWLSGKQSIVTQAELASHSKTDRMMVSKVLRTLEEKNFVTRVEHETDTRAKCISLTASGKKTTQKALIVVEKTDVDFFSVLHSEIPKFNKQMLLVMKGNG